jgi:negative regulator of sigma E activity
MKKIKHYKINLRVREILRILKNTTQVSDITPKLEEAVKRESVRLQKIVAPAAMYETQTKEHFPPELVSTPPGNWIAASVYLVTIGNDVEQEIKDARDRGETILSQILHAIALEALDQSANFIRRLINEEARDEECELSKNTTINSAEEWRKFCEAVPGDKIGVSFSGTSEFQPMYTSCGMIFWMPMKKRSAKTA